MPEEHPADHGGTTLDHTLSADLGITTLCEEPPNMSAADRVAFGAWFERLVSASLPSGAAQNVTSRALRNADCDGRLATRQPFVCEVAIATGIVAEQAVTADLQQGQHGDPRERAISTARWLKHQSGAVGDYLQAASVDDKHTVIDRVAGLVARARLILPGVDRLAYRIEAQSTVRYGRRGDRLTGFGRRDLVLSDRADPNSPYATVDIELKTGSTKPEFNLDQPRLYALLAHLQPPTQPAPQRIATVNLETGRWVVEEVTNELLVAVANKAVAVAARIHLLEHAPDEVTPRRCDLHWCDPCNNDTTTEVPA